MERPEAQRGEPRRVVVVIPRSSSGSPRARRARASASVAPLRSRAAADPLEPAVHRTEQRPVRDVTDEPEQRRGEPRERGQHAPRRSKRGERHREVLRERQRGLVPDVERAADDRAIVGVLHDVHDGAGEIVEVHEVCDRTAPDDRDPAAALLEEREERQGADRPA